MNGGIDAHDQSLDRLKQTELGEKIPSRLIKCFHYPKAVKKIDKLGNTRVVTEIRIKSVKIPRLST